MQEVFSSIHSDCIRSHAFYKLSKTCWGQEGTGDTNIKNKTRNKPAQLSARKKRDFKPSVWLFPLRATGSFYSALPHGGTEVFIRYSQGSKHQINGISMTPQVNSEVLSLPVAGQTAPEHGRC